MDFKLNFKYQEKMQVPNFFVCTYSSLSLFFVRQEVVHTHYAIVA